MRYFAFLRAINVGGRRLTNDDLLGPFRRCGLSDAAAYQAAGNVTFTAEDFSRKDLEQAFVDAFGFETSIFVRSQPELDAIVARRPFAEPELVASERRMQVAFLREPPTGSLVRQVTALVPVEDRFVVSGREAHWLPRTSISESTMPLRKMEQIIGPWTIRTAGTLERMLAKFGSHRL